MANTTNTTNTTSTANVPTDMPINELVKRLEDLRLPTTGGQMMLRERLRKALEPKENLSQTSETSGEIPGGGKAPMAICDGLEKLRKEALQSRLRELGLQVAGTKAVLCERLRRLYNEARTTKTIRAMRKMMAGKTQIAFMAETWRARAAV